LSAADFNIICLQKSRPRYQTFTRLNKQKGTYVKNCVYYKQLAREKRFDETEFGIDRMDYLPMFFPQAVKYADEVKK